MIIAPFLWLYVWNQFSDELADILSPAPAGQG
jgi:hypothetical protein